MDAPGFPEAFVIPSKATEIIRNLLINENKISTTILCPSLNLFEGSRTGNYRINDNNLFIFLSFYFFIFLSFLYFVKLK